VENEVASGGQGRVLLEEIRNENHVGRAA